jgi:hypothetical protein
MSNPTSPGLSDTEAQLAWLRQAYYGLDGRWYLKLREHSDAETAQVVDEAVCRSLGRLHVRAWRDLAGVDAIDDCRTFGRFVLDVLDTLYGDHRSAVRVVTDQPDLWEMQHTRCTIFDMGTAAGYAESPTPGALPGCRGILALYEGWVHEAGPFDVLQAPASGPPHGVACRYSFRRTDEE